MGISMSALRPESSSARAPLRYRCHACGEEVGFEPPFRYRCPSVSGLGGGEAGGGSRWDHLLTRTLHLPSYLRGAESCGGVLGTAAPDDPNPFVAFRSLLGYTWLAQAHGISDDTLVALIRALDQRVAEVDGQGFRRTPLRSLPGLESALGLSSRHALLLKVEAQGPSGSHKGRHLMGLMIWLRVLEVAGLLSARPPLAIASCGNAALAAAVVARAAEWPLEVFVPTDAEPEVLERLRALQARVTLCPRDGQLGDPTYRAFQQAVASGAFPFGCQGPDNFLTVEGGLTIGYELALQLREQGVQLERLILQVGGGALGSSIVQGLLEAHRLGIVPRLPHIDAVQTTRVAPFVRAWELACRVVLKRKGLALTPESFPEREGFHQALAARTALRLDERILTARPSFLARHRDRFMVPWAAVQPSLAHGILDDETYDWVALLEGVMRSRGRAVLIEEALLQRAWEAVRSVSDLRPCHTGVSGLAGAVVLAQAEGEERPAGPWAVILSGTARDGA